ncbi:hypothetical protein BK767_24145 [Bacillus thuringiensis serovar kyushuensis]|uniref:hypothetical protein n=1 Tax=Bacillus thuringiensis TaxID=1428 RepID=UPI000B4338D5|nr:hypothetical protein [Bacillus thuringiensis]MEC2866297.1 hypothetical protein [Bacillus cereus]OTZ65064.1 hypothetical protein BK767_24145 [Bacillus thuringiensis serovar kyushuensis]OTZ73562.1 hypothetical protein BK768_16075 [Bacillus thuringiensis serovar tohokuensis]OUB86963.1 hypothetical protein BK773_20085 [Bacillus thuringiensis serovar indiana]
MNVTLSRRRKGIWIGLVSLIMLSNYLLYALPIVPAAPKEVVLGSFVLCKQKVQRNAEKSAEACSYLFKSRF